jgi:alpha-galactosidase
MSSEQPLVVDESGDDALPSVPENEVKIAYIGGGSREWAPKLFGDLALCTELTGEVALFDLDYESAKLNAEFGEWVQNQQETVGEWTYEAVEERAKALDGADFVILSTQFDPAETFVHDLDVPREYGI